MTTTQDIKIPQTQFGVADFITARFSPRAFSGEPIADDTLRTLFEAASWAPSANNEQPWEYFYAHKNTPAFQQLWDMLMPGNQPWAQNAAVLAVAVARKTFQASGKNNVAAEHDLGMANTNLLLQAAALDIFGHPIGGFDKVRTAELLGLDEHRAPVIMLALGYLGEPDMLEEPYRTRELTPRTRKPLHEFVQAL